MNTSFHYPPELLSLVVDTIPRLCRSKDDVLLFFRGAGVSESVRADLRQQLKQDRASLNKFEIARAVLTRLNEDGEGSLRERREILKRVVEFEDFSTCWPADELKAKGLVAEIRRVVNVKDAFTRMNLERQKEVDARKTATEAANRAEAARKEKLAEAHRQFCAAVIDQNPQTRGSKLEEAANGLFGAHGISVRESFRLVDDKEAHVIEQIDGVIELDDGLYLVEMKWLAGPVGIGDVSRHLVRVYHRGQTRGLFVSATEFTDPALRTCCEALQRTVVVLVLVEELVLVLERHLDLRAFLKAKIQAAQIDKKPFVRIALDDPRIRGSS
jgi:restriction system protein